MIYSLRVGVKTPIEAKKQRKREREGEGIVRGLIEWPTRLQPSFDQVIVSGPSATSAET